MQCYAHSSTSLNEPPVGICMIESTSQQLTLTQATTMMSIATTDGTRNVNRLCLSHSTPMASARMATTYENDVQWSGSLAIVTIVTQNNTIPPKKSKNHTTLKGMMHIVYLLSPSQAW